LQPDGEQAAQFDDRFPVVVDPKVADPVDAFPRAVSGAKLLYHESRRLLAPPVAPGSVSRFERRHHPLRQRRGGFEERTPHRRKDVGVRQHVSLHCETGLDQVPGPIDALAPGEPRGTPIRRDSSQLSKLPISIVSNRLVDCRGWTDVPRKRVEDEPTVSRNDSHRLRRDGTNSGSNPRRHRANREVLRLNCAPDFAGCRIGGHNGERSSLH
jgi:hypothetical protein